MAMDVLERSGPSTAERVWRQAREEIERAEKRIEALEAERKSLGHMRRAQRSAVDEQISQQRGAIARWTERAEELDAQTFEPQARPAPVPMSPVDLDRTRASLVDPSTRLTATIGERPDSFAARETWTRAAAQLVTSEPAALEPAPEPATMDGLDLDI